MATTVAEVIARMRAVEAASRPADGVACFARLYRQVSEGVNAELARSSFADRRFLERLDVRFANLFFGALEGYERDRARAPSACLPLFAARSRRGIAPLQFALAGMNAHINRDLPIALVATCEGPELRRGSPEHSDFERGKSSPTLVFAPPPVRDAPQAPDIMGLTGPGPDATRAPGAVLFNVRLRRNRADLSREGRAYV